MTGLALIVLALAAQDPAQGAVALVQELRKAHAAAADSEVRLRLSEIVRRMSDRASIALCGEPDDPERLSLTVHDARPLLLRPPNRRSTDFWKWSRSENGAAVEEELLQGPLDEDLLLDFIRERTGSAAWDADATISRGSSVELVANAPPGLQRKVARALSDLQKELISDFRLTFWIFASSRPLAPEAGPDGALTDEAWEKVCRLAEEGTSIRRLGMVETSAQAEQTVSSFSGARRPVATPLAEGAPQAQTVSDGFAVEARAIPSGAAVLLRTRIAFTKLLGIDEVATAKGTLRLPRLASAELSDLRAIPSGRAVLLGSLGPFPPEAELPPHVTVVVRGSRMRP